MWKLEDPKGRPPINFPFGLHWTLPISLLTVATTVQPSGFDRETVGIGYFIMADLRTWSISYDPNSWSLGEVIAEERNYGVSVPHKLMYNIAIDLTITVFRPPRTYIVKHSYVIYIVVVAVRHMVLNKTRFLPVAARVLPWPIQTRPILYICTRQGHQTSISRQNIETIETTSCKPSIPAIFQLSCAAYCRNQLWGGRYPNALRQPKHAYYWGLG
jgi:hypothetical protein